MMAFPHQVHIQCCKSAHHIHPDQSCEVKGEAKEMLDLQGQLGDTVILKGFHHIEWAYCNLLLLGKTVRKPFEKMLSNNQWH